MAKSPKMLALTALFVLASSVAADVTPYFAPPSIKGPLVQTSNYTGFSNNTLNDTSIVKGKSFNRFIQIWLENTDFAVAASTETFINLAKDGLLLTNYQGTTHPSEPNYVASIAGDHFGMWDDDYYHIPSNISNILDILEGDGITWATYQENMPTDGYNGETYTSQNYQNASAAPYVYYRRKHNPPIIFDSVNTNATRAQRVRNFNDLANDVVNGSLSQWIFITPNMDNDAHDTTIDFAAEFLEYFLVPLLNNTGFNDNETVILLTFDENESYGIENTLYSLVLGNGLPEELKGTEDDTFYTHYSTISTVQANWDLKTLGRNDANKTMANVFSWVANAINYTNVNVSDADRPQLNLTGVYPGPMNAAIWVPFTAPNMSATSPTGKGVFVASSLNTSYTTAMLPAPVNLTAQGVLNPYIYPAENATEASTSANGAGAAGMSMCGLVMGVLMTVFMA